MPSSAKATGKDGSGSSYSTSCCTCRGATRTKGGIYSRHQNPGPNWVDVVLAIESFLFTPLISYVRLPPAVHKALVFSLQSTLTQGFLFEVTWSFIGCTYSSRVGMGWWSTNLLFGPGHPSCRRKGQLCMCPPGAPEWTCLCMFSLHAIIWVIWVYPEDCIRFSVADSPDWWDHGQPVGSNDIRHLRVSGICFIFLQPISAWGVWWCLPMGEINNQLGTLLFLSLTSHMLSGSHATA